MSSIVARRVVAATLVILGLVGVLWGAFVLRAVHQDVAEVTWLRDHAPARSYRVAELGEVDPGGHLDAVWVDVPGRPRAFIDLSRSQEQVHAVGDRVRARVDEREAPALGDGLPEDVVTTGQVGRYVGPGALVLVGLVLAGAGVVAGRGRHAPGAVRAGPRGLRRQP